MPGGLCYDDLVIVNGKKLLFQNNFRTMEALAMEPIQKRKIWKCILLTLVTCGIYGWYWMYLLLRNVRTVRQVSGDCVGEFVCLLLLPGYRLYWGYVNGELLKRKAAERGDTVLGGGGIYLALFALGLGTVAMAIMQNDFNNLSTLRAATAPQMGMKPVAGQPAGVSQDRMPSPFVSTAPAARQEDAPPAPVEEVHNTAPTSEACTAPINASAAPAVPAETASADQHETVAAAPSGKTPPVYDAVTAQAAPARVKKQRSPMVSRVLTVRFFRSAAILLLSVFVLLTAFLPVIKMDTGTQLTEYIGLPFDFEMRFNCIDTFTFFFDNLKNETPQEQMESRLYDEEQDLQAELVKAFTGYVDASGNIRDRELTREQERLLEKTVRLTLRTSYRSEQTAFSPAVLLVAVASLLYILFAIAFFVVSLLQFLLYLLRGRLPGSAGLRLLCFVPGATLALFFAYRVFTGSVLKASATGTVIACVVTTAVLLLVAMVAGMVSKEIRLKTGSAVRACLTCICTLVTLCVLLLSPLSVKLTGKFATTSLVSTTATDASSVKVKLDWSFFDSVSLTDKELDHFDENLTDALMELGDYQRSDFSRGTAAAISAVHTATAYVLRMATGDGRNMTVFAFLPVLAFLAALALSWVMAEALLYFVTGNGRSASCLAARITALVSVFLLLIVLIVTVAICDITLDNSTIYNIATSPVFGDVVGENGLVRRMIRMRLTAVPFVVLAFSVLAVAIPAPGKKKQKVLPPAEAEGDGAAWY